jgi:hypothetical protein
MLTNILTLNKKTTANKQHHNRQMQIIEYIFYALGIVYWIGIFVSM